MDNKNNQNDDTNWHQIQVKVVELIASIGYGQEWSSNIQTECTSVVDSINTHMRFGDNEMTDRCWQSNWEHQRKRFLKKWID